MSRDWASFLPARERTSSERAASEGLELQLQTECNNNMATLIADTKDSERRAASGERQRQRQRQRQPENDDEDADQISRAWTPTADNGHASDDHTNQSRGCRSGADQKVRSRYCQQPLCAMACYLPLMVMVLVMQVILKSREWRQHHSHCSLAVLLVSRDRARDRTRL